jgi:hypothetical protein
VTVKYMYDLVMVMVMVMMVLQIDPQLLRVMHPHQVVAVEFLLRRLTTPLPSASTAAIPTAAAVAVPTAATSAADTAITTTAAAAAAMTTAASIRDSELDCIFDTDEDMHSSSDDDDDDDDESFLEPETVTLLQQQRLNKKRKMCRAVSTAGPEFKDCRGAVLADEMGLGKSLVSIAVLWHFVNHGESLY